MYKNGAWAMPRRFLERACCGTKNRVRAIPSASRDTSGFHMNDSDDIFFEDVIPGDTI
jgi:hypothetical protein